MSQTTTVKAADLKSRTHLDLSRVRQIPLRPSSPQKAPDLISKIVEKLRTTGFNIQDFEKDDIRRFVGILGDDLRSRGYTKVQIDNEILSNPEIIDALKGHIVNFREIMSGNVIINAVNGKLSNLGIKLNPSQTAHLSQYVRIMGKELAVKGYKINEIIEKLTNDGQIRKLRDVLSFIEKEKKLLNEGVDRRILVDKRKGAIDPRKITEMRKNVEQTISDEITQRAKGQANTIKTKSNIIDLAEARKKHQPSSTLEDQPRNRGANFRKQPKQPVTSLDFKKPPATNQNEVKSNLPMPPLSIATAVGVASIDPSTEIKIHSNSAQPRADGSVWTDAEMEGRAAPKYDRFSAAKSSIKGGFTPTNLIGGGVLSLVGGGVAALGDPKVQPYLFIPKNDKEHELDQKIAKFKVGAGAVRGLVTGIAAIPAFLGTTALLLPETGPFAPVIGFGAAWGAAGAVNIPLKMSEEAIEHWLFDKGKKEQAAKRAPREMLHLYSRATAIRIWLKNIDPKIIQAEKMIGPKIIKPPAPRAKEIEILQELMRDLGYYRGGIPLEDIVPIFFDEWKNGKQPWDKFFNTENGVMFFKPEITEKYIKKEIKNPEEEKEMLDLFRARNKPIINGVLDKSALKALEAFFGRDISQINRETFVEIRKALLSYADKCQAESEAIGKKYGISIQGKKTHK